jgi:hypothetical protein
MGPAKNRKGKILRKMEDTVHTSSSSVPSGTSPPFGIAYYPRYFRAMGKYRKKRTSCLVTHEKHRGVLPVVRKKNALKKRVSAICSEKQRISCIPHPLFSLAESTFGHAYIIVISKHEKNKLGKNEPAGFSGFVAHRLV